MNVLSVIISKDVVPYLLVVCYLAGSVGFAFYLHSFLKRTFLDSILHSQKFLDRKHLLRIISFFVSLFPAQLFPLALSPLDFPVDLKSFFYELSLVASQVLFFLLLVNILLPSLDSWLSMDSLRRTGRDGEVAWERKKEKYLFKKKRLFLVTQLLLAQVGGFIVLVDMGITFSTIRLILLVLIVFSTVYLMRTFLEMKGLQGQQTGALKKQVTNGDKETVPEDDPDYQLRIAIVELFLQVYSYQLNKKTGLPVKYSRVDGKSHASRYTYELHAKVNGDWKSRRMTIGRLGMDVVSRSKCFFVIYDAYLVVKIPPEPITDIKKYIAILRKETRIASKLEMQDCIIPKLSVILKHVHHSFTKETTFLEEVEADYLKPLFVFSYLHNFLKINGSFVFFMDLSKYHFLHDVISDIHDSKRSVYEEMCMDFDGYGSVHRYNPPEKSSEFFRTNIAKAYAEYQSRIETIEETSDFFLPSSSWIRKTFFMRLAGYSRVESGGDAARSVSDTMNEIIDDIFLSFEPFVTSYQQGIRKTVSFTTFKKNKTIIEGIVTNLLNLLAQLGEKEVAVRDLKPDNLLVAGDRDMYPLFLADPQSFTIGLIDVETAVIYNRSHKRKIAQPQLGGTDQFATPSHFFGNQTIMQLFGSLSDTLHLQDWYAITAIIYNVVLGDFLFEKTSGFIPIIVKEIGKSMAKGERNILLAQKLSILFWKQAVAEFDEKIQNNRQILGDVKIQVGTDFQMMLKRMLVDEYQDSVENLKKCISTRKLFRSRKNRAYFSSLSNSEFADLLDKLERGEGVSSHHIKDRNEIIRTLSEFSQLKAQYTHCRHMLKLLKGSSVTLPTDLLLESMFGVVRHNMWKQEWKSRDLEVVVDGDIAEELRRTRGTVKATMHWQTL